MSVFRQYLLGDNGDIIVLILGIIFLTLYFKRIFLPIPSNNFTLLLYAKFH